MSLPKDKSICIFVNGTELALLRAATAISQIWSFERPAARARRECLDEEALQSADARVVAESHRLLDEAGALRARDEETQELIARRALLRGEVRLAPQQLRTIVHVLELCYEEFFINWIDFYLVSPGQVDRYGTTPEDLLGLAEKLRALLPSPLRRAAVSRRTSTGERRHAPAQRSATDRMARLEWPSLPKRRARMQKYPWSGSRYCTCSICRAKLRKLLATAKTMAAGQRASPATS